MLHSGSMSKLVLALVLGLGSHLVAGQPAVTAQTLGDQLEHCACAVQPTLWGVPPSNPLEAACFVPGGVSLSKSLGDLVSEDVLPENLSVPAMRVALR